MSKSENKIVCFGEVLWDILPSGTVPGGAPVNVAYHLHQLQKDVTVITRIGNDKEGQQLLDLFRTKGMSAASFQIDKHHETGKVYAKQDGKGDMTYDIVKPVAWDFIEWHESFSKLLSDSNFFVYGSLAAREKQSRETLFSLLEAAPRKVLDINLRAPHYQKDLLLELLNKADLLKMNEDELDLVSPWFSMHTDLEDKMKAIGEKLELDVFVVTKGAHGATLLMNDNFFSHPGKKVEVVDTVGSGDAFLASVLSSLIDKNTPSTILENAIKLGAFVATKSGGMPAYNLSDVEKS